MNIFFIKKTGNNTAILEMDEAKHCLRVLRKKMGEHISCIDGLGNMYLAAIASKEQEVVNLNLIETHPNWGEHGRRLELAISPLRHKDRLEWAIEKAVELGVTDIYPIICARTVKTGIKLPRLQKIIKIALKQCKRSRLPILHEPLAIEDYIKQSQAELKFVPWCEEAQPLQDFSDQISASPHTAIMIGPEGDFTDDEIKIAKMSDFIPVSLGFNRLRTETAAIYGMSVLKWSIE